MSFDIKALKSYICVPLLIYFLYLFSKCYTTFNGHSSITLRHSAAGESVKLILSKIIYLKVCSIILCARQESEKHSESETYSNSTEKTWTYAAWILICNSFWVRSEELLLLVSESQFITYERVAQGKIGN